MFFRQNHLVNRFGQATLCLDSKCSFGKIEPLHPIFLQRFALIPNVLSAKSRGVARASASRFALIPNVLSAKWQPRIPLKYWLSGLGVFIKNKNKRGDEFSSPLSLFTIGAVVPETVQGCFLSVLTELRARYTFCPIALV